MSALVRTIRRAILGEVANKNQVLKEALESLGIEAGQSDPTAMLKLQQIILNSGRDSEVQLRRSFTGLNLTGGGTGRGEVHRIRNALLRSGRESELRAAIDDLISLTPGWVEDFRAPSGDVPTVGDFAAGNYWTGSAESSIDGFAVPNQGESLEITADGIYTGGAGASSFPDAGTVLFNALEGRLAAGFTLVVGFVDEAGADDSWLITLEFDAGADGFELGVDGAPDSRIYFSHYATDVTTTGNGTVTSGIRQKVALKYAAGQKAKISLNGESVVQSSSNMPTFTSLQTFNIGHGFESTQPVTIGSIAVYLAQPDVDLPTLSAL